MSSQPQSWLFTVVISFIKQGRIYSSEPSTRISWAFLNSVSRISPSLLTDQAAWYQISSDTSFARSLLPHCSGSLYFTNASCVYVCSTVSSFCSASCLFLHFTSLRVTLEKSLLALAMQTATYFLAHKYIRTFLLPTSNSPPVPSTPFNIQNVDRLSNMKSTSIFIITLGLLVITSVTAIRPAYPSPRALGDGSVSVARDVPTVSTQGSNSTPSDTINDYTPNVAIVGPGGTMPNACTDCSYSLNDCYTHCGGGDRGSCNDYCKCEALLRKDCQPKGEFVAVDSSNERTRTY